MKKTKLYIFALLFLIIPKISFGLIEVDITRGNLDPLPIAVSPLFVESKSVKEFQNLLKKENIGEDISSVVESNLKSSGLFNPLKKEAFLQKPDIAHLKPRFEDWSLIKAQIFSCWSIPLGLPYNENLLVRIKLELKPDGTVIRSEILDHARMNKPGQGFYKVLAESALRAIKLCQPLRVPTKGYERWKNLQLNFDAREMLQG